MRYPLDELLDKRSIVLLKMERIEDPSEKERLKKEFKDYSEAITDYVNDGLCDISQVERWHCQLYEANGKTWNLESMIRAGQLGNLEDITLLAKIGRTAVKIRESNGVRIGIKSKIVEAIGIGYKDIKINHASEDSLRDYKSKP